jgi:hypothetical protein
MRVRARERLVAHVVQAGVGEPRIEHVSVRRRVQSVPPARESAAAD